MNLKVDEFLDKFHQIKVLVIGDVMLDRYWWGSVTRISPEAPVPVVNLESESVIVGGAANVATNIKGLGATPYLVGIIGDDADGEILCETLKSISVNPDYLIKVQNRPTTVKTRIVAHQQQIVRVDQEVTLTIDNNLELICWDQISRLIGETDIIIISDYAKGFLTENLLMRLITKAQLSNKQILVDPKGKTYQKYKSSTLLTPNRKEAIEASNISDVLKAGEFLLKNFELESLLITQGEDGMTIFEKGKPPNHLEALARHVYDVTGAGDTVIATLGVSLASGLDLNRSAQIANIAAGCVVEEVGTTAIKIERLKKEII